MTTQCARLSDIARSHRRKQRQERFWKERQRLINMSRSEEEWQRAVDMVFCDFTGTKVNWQKEGF